MDNLKIKLRIPSWAAKLYISLSLITIPWTIYLDYNLPVRHVFHHWDVAWVGLDAALIIMLLLTGLLASRKSLWVVITAVTTGSLLIIDAWFDVLGASAGKRFLIALVLACLIELPLAFISYSLAYRAIIKNIPENNQ